MKKIFFLLFLSLFILSCKTSKNVQVYYTEGLNTQLKSSQHVYENDTLKITYNFLTDRGSIIFFIENKLDRSIYIDWERSHFTINGNRLVYSHNYKGKNKIYTYPYLSYSIPINEQKRMVKVRRQKNEENLIAAKGNLGVFKYYILPEGDIKLTAEAKQEEVQHNQFPEKTTIVTSQDYTMVNSPLQFSNKLTFYFSDSFREEFSIENKFYVNKIKEMAHSHFFFKKRDEKGKPTGTYIMTHGFPTYFFVDINKAIRY